MTPYSLATNVLFAACGLLLVSPLDARGAETDVAATGSRIASPVPARIVTSDEVADLASSNGSKANSTMRKETKLDYNTYATSDMDQAEMELDDDDDDLFSNSTDFHYGGMANSSIVRRHDDLIEDDLLEDDEDSDLSLGNDSLVEDMYLNDRGLTLQRKGKGKWGWGWGWWDRRRRSSRRRSRRRVNCEWHGWGGWGGCSKNCGSGSKSRSRSIKRNAAHGGSGCGGGDSESTTCNTHNCPVNCQWNGWGGWGGCNKNCGTGKKYRYRSVKRNAAHGGSTCRRRRGNSQSTNCNTHHCPVNCAWRSWNGWGSCDKSCGSGTKKRYRSKSRNAAHGGSGCSGGSSQSTSCNTHHCPVHCTWKSWGGWGGCNKNCGTGKSYRYRGKNNARHGGNACSGSSSQNRNCNTHHCPVNCQWNSWASWNACSKNCGTGHRLRFRSIKRNPAHGGAACSGATAQSGSCNTHSCPVACTWQSWSGYGACSVSCGGGTQSRTRGKNGPFHGGAACSGSSSQQRTCGTAACPIDCQWDGWQSWGSCSKTCGTGVRHRHRAVKVVAKYNGKACPAPAQSTGACNTHHCPIDCTWKAWAGWGTCSKTCGGGTQSRNRGKNNAQHGGNGCSGVSSQTQSCGTIPCPIHCVWNTWSGWNTCSLTCGSGTQTRSRTVKIQAAHGGKACESPSTQNQVCNTNPCPVHCEMSGWSGFGSCTKSCGTGTQDRTRTVTVAAAHGGTACPSTRKQTQNCNTHHCPIDCTWKAWSTWATCSVTCGGGTQGRTRGKNLERYGGAPCTGPATGSQVCSTYPCPIHCVWNTWNAWGTCTKTCAGGTQVRTRTVKIAARYGGNACPTPSSQTQDCNTHPCPIHCVWDTWQAWKTCSTTCGGGTKLRDRVIKIAAKYGGNACVGGAEDSGDCATNPCPIHCEWGNWQAWGLCTKSCGSGSQNRKRVIAIPAQHGGNACVGSDTDTQNCNTHPCPIDCKWAAWGSWGTCTHTCGTGAQDRKRTKDVLAQYGGDECDGDFSDTQECATNPCPIHCAWGDWAEFGDCTKTCAGGTQYRLRPVAVFKQYGGNDCVGDAHHVQACETQPCPIDGVWDDWKAWGQCPVTCGGGQEQRARDVKIPAQWGGLELPGNATQLRDCGMLPCPIHCAWADWEDWQTCSVSCGGGHWSRSRTVAVVAQHGGTECHGDSESNSTCNTHNCPIDCVWNDWSAWQDCPVTCGGSTHEKMRTVKVQAQWGGEMCHGNHTDIRPCGTIPCPVHCEWTEWGEWDNCGKSCGGGKQNRSRSITQTAAHGGTACVPSDAIGIQDCNVDPCPIHCKWVDWQAWTECSHSCGGGHQQRTRFVDTHSAHGGEVCKGNSTEIARCNEMECTTTTTTYYTGPREDITGSFIINGIDYDTLVGNPDMLALANLALEQSLVEEVGGHVSRDDVNVSMSDGSTSQSLIIDAVAKMKGERFLAKVKIVYNVQVPPYQAWHAASTLSENMANGEFSARLFGKLAKIANIEATQSSPLAISDSKVGVVTTTHTTTTPPTTTTTSTTIEWTLPPTSPTTTTTGTTIQQISLEPLTSLNPSLEGSSTTLAAGATSGETHSSSTTSSTSSSTTSSTSSIVVEGGTTAPGPSLSTTPMSASIYVTATNAPGGTNGASTSSTSSFSQSPYYVSVAPSTAGSTAPSTTASTTGSSAPSSTGISYVPSSTGSSAPSSTGIVQSAPDINEQAKGAQGQDQFQGQGFKSQDEYGGQRPMVPEGQQRNAAPQPAPAHAAAHRSSSLAACGMVMLVFLRGRLFT